MAAVELNGLTGYSQHFIVINFETCPAHVNVSMTLLINNRSSHFRSLGVSWGRGTDRLDILARML